MNFKNKYVIHLSYLGTNYSGWQIQNNAKSVQGFIMEGLHCILSKDILLIVGAGRTDAGVHAINYYAHFEYADINEQDLTFKLNNFLPRDIVINYIKVVSKDFHARFSAVSRKYEYWITTKKDPFLIDRAFYFNKKLDVKKMNCGADLLKGKNNFSSFTKLSATNLICNVTSAYWIQSKNMLIFSIESDRFLYNMVRCIVGTLMDLGLNKIDLQTFEAIINSHDRSNAGFSAPAYGLYLVNISYPKKYNFEKI